MKWYDAMLCYIIVYRVVRCAILCYMVFYMFNPHKFWENVRFPCCSRALRFERTCGSSELEVRANQAGTDRFNSSHVLAKWTSRTVEFRPVRPPEVWANLRFERTWGSSDFEVRANQAGTGRALLCLIVVYDVMLTYIMVYGVVSCVIPCCIVFYMFYPHKFGENFRFHLLFERTEVRANLRFERTLRLQRTKLGRIDSILSRC